MADFEKLIPNSERTIFKIASITKQFTAAAVLMLEERQFLSINDPISEYFSNYPNGKLIKIINLLNHTSGIPEHISDPEFWDQINSFHKPEDIMEFFIRKPHKPANSKFEYCNSNYILLGMIIEKLTKTSYEGFLKQNIFTPLGMESSGYNRFSNPANEAVGYEQITPFPITAQPIHMSVPFAAGGIYSTVEDIYKWYKALLGGELIGQDKIAEMLTPGLGNYGFGWYVGKTASNNSTVVFHAGNICGFTSYIEARMEAEQVLILLSNNEGADLYSIARQIMNS